MKKKNQKGQLCTLFGRGERRRKKTTGNNPTTIHHHASHHKKKYMVALPKNDGRLCLGIEWRHMHCLNSDDVTNSLVHNEHAIATFLNKKANSKREKYQNTLLITKTNYMKVQKYPQLQTLFFVFSKINNIF